MPLSLTSAESTELFVGSDNAPQQVVRVGYAGVRAPTTVRVDGDGLAGEAVLVPAGSVVEVAVDVAEPRPGRKRAASVDTGDRRLEFTFTDAEPGWTMHMVSHFHYDPVWWNTQAAYTSEWTEDPPGRARQTNGFDLVAAHLEMARRDPEYKFVLAEVDYLKPYWDTHPEDRDDLRRFVAQGRVEIMGGTYNEPNTNLTSPETAIRNFVAGIGFQRHIMGADPATAWQLDVFGHDPQFPGMAADVGLTSSSWARGPHHQWGPMADNGDPERMQFCSEFEWIAPSGVGLLTHYMPAHYSAGWWMDSAATLTEAETATYELFTGLKKVASTRNVLLPVGTDYTPPNKWVTEIHRDWNARYTWPKFVCALPREFFAAVRAELGDRQLAPAPQTRDMNPIYTGKDVSFIDTKQANRAAEAAVLDAERFATFAALLTGADYPEPALAKAWVQLAYGAHHDAITGSESDQVYLDLLTGWRDAWELGRTARDNALAVLTAAVGGAPLMVWNPLAHSRTDVVTVHLEQPIGALYDDAGDAVPVLAEDGGRTLTFLAREVPSLGWRAYSVGTGPGSGWQPFDGAQIANAHYTIRVDPARGGGVESVRHRGRELIADGHVGNEIAVYAEHPSHPKAGEGPWHLLPRGPVAGSSEGPGEVRAYRSAIGERLVVRGTVEGLTYTQTLTLWDGVDRVDCRTVIDEFSGADQLIRLRWPMPVPGALPVSEVGDAVVGRGFGLLHDPGATRSVDTADHPWTLENPAFGWFGLSSTARIKLADNSFHSIAVAEVVTPEESASAPLARDLMVALVRAGVTATCSGAGKPRYGHLAVDSNLPDTRIALGGPQHNAFTAAVLAAADPGYGAELHRQLATSDHARVLVPAAVPLAAEWVPDADLRGIRALPVLVIAASSASALTTAIAALTDDLDDNCIEVTQRLSGGTGPMPEHTVAVLNRGVPSFAVEADGTLHTSLMRSCTGWPSGVWTTHEARRLPDGSNFQLQHWTHTFDYAVAAGSGDWRQARIPSRSAEFSRPLLTVAGAAGDRLPAPGSLLRIDGTGVALDAVKPAGNPTPQGSARRCAGDTTALRIVEQHGADARIAVSSDVAAVRVIGKCDLLEQRVRDGDPTMLHGFEIATVTARLDAGTPAAGRAVRLAPDAETAQPLYARYWLHNRGPAPLGGLPAVAHLHPHRLIADGPQVSLRLTVAGDCVDAQLTGTVELIGPPGWAVAPQQLPFALEPGGHRAADLVVSIPPDSPPGCYPVRAQLTLTDPDLPVAWRQTVEDVCLVTVGAVGAEVLRLVDGPIDTVVAAGATATLRMTVGTDLAADTALEAHLISPWGTWEWLGPAVVGAELPAGGQADLEFTVNPPPGTKPGQWWALVRVAAAGVLLYSPSVRVTVP
jgi:alpha-mannosidase